MKTKFNFKTILMFLVSTLGVAREKPNYVCFCTNFAKASQVGDNINKLPSIN
jgi:hypothetical protein